MRSIKGRSRGFTLIASLLVLALLSAIAISLLFMVQGAGQVGNNDLETNRAYYGAESGMELLTANLAALYQQSQAPTPAQLTALAQQSADQRDDRLYELPGERDLDAGCQRQPKSHHQRDQLRNQRGTHGGDRSLDPESQRYAAGRRFGEHDAGRGSGAHPGIPVRCFFRQRLELLRRPQFQLCGASAHQRQPVPG